MSDDKLLQRIGTKGRTFARKFGRMSSKAGKQLKSEATTIYGEVNAMARQSTQRVSSEARHFLTGVLQADTSPVVRLAATVPHPNRW